MERQKAVANRLLFATAFVCCIYVDAIPLSSTLPQPPVTARADVVCPVDQGRQPVGLHLGSSAVHMEQDGLPFVPVEVESAYCLKNPDRAASVALYPVGVVSPGCTYIVQEGGYDDAAGRDVAGIGQGIAAGLKGMPGEASEMSVMAVASGPEVVASLKVCDSCFNALAPCRSQKADDVLSDFFVFHSVGVFYSSYLIYLRSVIIFRHEVICPRLFIS